MIIENVEFEGISYPVTTYKTSENDFMKFNISVNVNDSQLKVEYTQALINDLKSVCGLDLEEELKNIVIFELKAKIFERLYDTTVKEQFNKVQALVGKSDSDLQMLIDNDELFAIYMRNFHLGL